MNLLIVRHGESIANTRGIMHGWTDGELTTNGIQHVERFSHSLLDRNIDIIWTSDLRRAKQTAQIISRNVKTKIIIDNRLREMNLGILERLSEKEGHELFPDVFRNYSNLNNFKYTIPEGESRKDCSDRIISFLNELCKTENINKTFLIVTHSGPIDHFMRFFLGYRSSGWPKWQIKNCVLNEFQWVDNKWKLVKWGC